MICKFDKHTFQEISNRTHWTDPKPEYLISLESVGKVLFNFWGIHSICSIIGWMHELDLVVWNHARFFKTIRDGLLRSFCEIQNLEFQLFNIGSGPTGCWDIQKTHIYGRHFRCSPCYFGEPKSKGETGRIMCLTLPAICLFINQIQMKWIEKYAAEWDVWGQIRCPLDIPI